MSQDANASAATDGSTVFRVPIRQSDFGRWLDAGLDGLLFVFYRGTHGWKCVDEGTLQYTKLPGQLYVEAFDGLIKQYGVREVCAVDLVSGNWKTLWASSDAEVSYP